MPAKKRQESRLDAAPPPRRGSLPDGLVKELAHHLKEVAKDRIGRC
jgi:hypothetical protein